MDGLTFLEQALQRDPGVYVILMTGLLLHRIRHRSHKARRLRLSAQADRPARLKKTIEELSEQFDRRRRIRDLEQRLVNDLEFHGIVGRSPAMLELFEMARKISRHYINVLLQGPTGTGKELVAHAIHQMSPVANQRFAVCNCSAIVDTLLESQLFGHVRGAFTGATETRAGLFEYANGGTVFLDEVGETSLAMQAKLLRVIQNREIQRVGSPEVRHVDVRLIAATNRDLRAEVAAGSFREDLFYRLSTIQIRVPSLVERLEDVPSLITFFVKKYNTAYEKQIQGLTRRAQAVLLQARLARQCARTRKRHLQRRAGRAERFHRRARSAGAPAKAGRPGRIGEILAPAPAGRGAQGAHRARARVMLAAIASARRKCWASAAPVSIVT